MKKTSRVLAALLCFVMLVGMLPAVALGAAPTAPVTAYLADTVTVNGSLTEGWLMTTNFDASAGGPAGKLGAQWDAENLYLAMETGTATKVSVTLGTVTTVYDIAAGTFTPAVAGATAAASGTKLEMALPFEACGIETSTASQKVTFSAQLQTASKTSDLKAGGLTLLYNEIIYATDLDNYASDGFSASSLALLDHTTIGINADAATGAVDFTKAENTSSAAIKGISHPIAYNGGAFDVEYTVKINDLPTVGNTGMAHWRGFVVELDNTSRYRYSLTRDASNNVLFNAMYAGGTSDGAARTVDTGLQVGDTATIRASVDKDNVLRLYVNGMLVQKFDAIDQTSPDANNYFEIYVNYADITGGGVDVELYDIAFSKPGPEPALGASVYYTENSVTVDGALDEDWLMVGEFEASAGGPAGKLGAQWDETNLYLAMETGTATKVGVTLGTVSTVYDIAAGTFTPAVAGASAAASGTKLEMALPLAACGIMAKPADQNVAFTAFLQSGDKSSALKGNGKLNLRYTKILFASDLDNFADDGFTAGQFEFGNAGGISFAQTTDGAMRVTYGGGSFGIKGVKYPAGYTGGAFDLEYTVKLSALPIAADAALAHWRGFVVEVDHLDRNRFSLTRDASNNVLFNAGYHTDAHGDGTTKSVDTGLQVGDTATIRASVDDTGVRLYVNGVLVATMDAIDWSPLTGNTFFEIYCNFAGNESGSLDVSMYDFALTQPLASSDAEIAQRLLDSLTFEDIKGANTSESMIVADLEPVETLEFFGTEYDLTWTTSDADVLAADGSVTGGSFDGEDVKYTASVKVGAAVKTKTFELTVYETVDATLLYLDNDLNPYTGAMNTTNVPVNYTLDKNYSSVGYDLGSVQSVNSVVLTDRDGVHKMHKINLSLYVSDDNVTYTKVEDFTMANAGKSIYLYNFTAEGRYVKVHCHYDTDEAASFTNSLPAMIWAGYESELPGSGGGAFEEIGAVTVTASADGKDAVAYVPYKDLGVYVSDLQADRRDLRLVLNGDVLSYWLDDDGVYIRVPQAVKNSALALTIYGKNPDADNLSDMEAVFEVTYGNKTIQNLTQGLFNGNITVTEAPNGDIIALGNDSNDPHKLLLRRSEDGGRTWSDAVTAFDAGDKMIDGGGLLVDNGTIWYFGHYGKSLGAAWDEVLKVAVLRSDDNGYTWSAPTLVETDYYYHVMYCDGVKVASYDGSGPEIDYVAGYHFMEQPDSSGFMSTVIYSRDAGATWQTSESKINYSLPASGLEGGVTEAAIAVLSDGTLKMLCRCQYDTVYWLCEATSTDNGLTWTQSTASNVTSTNTMPDLKNYEDEIHLLWAGNNGMGCGSYQRYPLNLAYSDDDMKTWQKKHDLYGGTSLGQYPVPGSWWKNPSANLTIEPGMVFTDYAGSEDLVVAWWMNWMTNYVMLIEDADDFIHNTKGAADSFEGVSAKYENWLPAANVGTVAITTDKAANGNQSLKITDGSEAVMVRATRSIPAMYAGELNFDVYIEQANSAFYLELKTAYTTAHSTADRIMLCIDADGNIKSLKPDQDGAIDANLGTISLNSWHNLKLSFDLNTGAATLFVDGQERGSVYVDMSSTDSVSFIQISDGSGSANGLSCYIDNFIAYEGVTLTALELNDDASVQSITADKAVLTYDDANGVYTSEVPFEVDSVVLNVETTDPAATVIVNGADYNGEAVELKTGINFVNIRVDAPSKSASTWHTLVIYRSATPSERTVAMSQPVISTRPYAADVQLNVSIDPADDAAEVLWTTADHTVATVDANGLVSIKGEGLTYITATTVYGYAICIVSVAWSPLNPDLIPGYGDTDIEPEWKLKDTLIEYIDGYPDGTFGPERIVTRGEMAQMLFNIIEFRNITPSHSYTDIAGSWVDNPVGMLCAVGVLDDEGGKFNMNAPATRADFVQAMARILKVEGDATLEGFKDTDGHELEGIFAAFKAMGILDGYADGTVQPEKGMTRAEMVTIINRAVGVEPEAGPSPWPDVPAGHWACGHIRAATESQLKK